jgi:hypothetical protein
MLVTVVSKIFYLIRIACLGLVLIFLSGCNSNNYHVALYKDNINTKAAILAVFPSKNLQVGMENCEATAELYKADDKAKNIISFITDLPPAYYCLEFEGKV